MPPKPTNAASAASDPTAKAIADLKAMFSAKFDSLSDSVT